MEVGQVSVQAGQAHLVANPACQFTCNPKNKNSFHQDLAVDRVRNNYI